MAIYVYTDEFIPEYYAHYPLITNANDTSGNDRNITTSWATSYGSDGAVFPNSNHDGLLIPFNIDFSQKWTICTYTKITWYNNVQDSRLIDIYNSSNRIDCRVDTASRKYLILKNNSSELYRSSYTLWEWLCICITVDNWSVKTYTNWTLNATTTFTGITTYFRFWQEYNKWADRHLYGNIKEIIIEDKARTAQEVSDYFNGTKSNYGIQ